MFINRFPTAIRYLTPKAVRAMTATRPNPPTAAMPPIRTVCFSWPGSVDIKTSEQVSEKQAKIIDVSQNVWAIDGLLRNDSVTEASARILEQ